MQTMIAENANFFIDIAVIVYNSAATAAANIQTTVKTW